MVSDIYTLSIYVSQPERSKQRERLFCYRDVKGENSKLNSEFGEKWATV